MKPSGLVSCESRPPGFRVFADRTAQAGEGGLYLPFGNSIALSSIFSTLGAGAAVTVAQLSVAQPLSQQAEAEQHIRLWNRLEEAAAEQMLAAARIAAIRSTSSRLAAAGLGGRGTGWGTGRSHKGPGHTEDRKRPSAASSRTRCTLGSPRCTSSRVGTISVAQKGTFTQTV